MSNNDFSKMGVHDLFNLNAGKDWHITVNIPNRILRKYPMRVMWLQTQIKLQLESFNKEIQQLEKGITPKAEIKEIKKTPEEKTSKEVERSVLLKMEADRKKREGGGGGGYNL